MPIPNLTNEKRIDIIKDIINNLENAMDGAIQIGDTNLGDDLECIINDLKENID